MRACQGKHVGDECSFEDPRETPPQTLEGRCVRLERKALLVCSPHVHPVVEALDGTPPGEARVDRRKGGDKQGSDGKKRGKGKGGGWKSPLVIALLALTVVLLGALCWACRPGNGVQCVGCSDESDRGLELRDPDAKV